MIHHSRRLIQLLSCYLDYRTGGSLLDSRPGSLLKSAEVPEFERFVFIICVLERYSIHDCALLLGKSPREVNEARHRVSSQVGQIDELCNISQRFAMR